jgi:hypothetical protein
MAGPPARRVGDGLVTPYCKNLTCYKTYCCIQILVGKLEGKTTGKTKAQMDVNIKIGRKEIDRLMWVGLFCLSI